MGYTARRPRRRSIRGSRQAVVERAEAYVRAHITTPVAVAQLSREVGLSERGLRNAFYAVHGVSPRQWMVAARLRNVRQALVHAPRGRATVTHIATDYGFYELGRFAAAYRHMFGEAPSRTLRGAR
jgi:AraC-like DNA-binding protein